VLHVAISLSQQAKPQTLHTQILNYNAPPKHYNLKDLYLQYKGMGIGLYYVSVIAEDDGMLGQSLYRMNRLLLSENSWFWYALTL